MDEPRSDAAPTVAQQPAAPVQPQPAPEHPSYLIYVSAAVALLVIGIVAYIYISRGSTETAQSKMYHIGILSALSYFDPTAEGFKHKMAELGYTEGANITYDMQKATAPVGNQAIIQKFVDDGVDLIYVFPTEASLETKEVTKGTNIPMIFSNSAVEGNPLIMSVQQPGDNVTGVRFPIPEVAAKRLEILHSIAPHAKRIWVPVLKDYPTVSVGMEAAEKLAVELGLTLVEVPFASPDELAAYLQEHDSAPGMDAILTVPEPLSILPPFTEQIYAFADAHHIPIAGAEVRDSDSGPIFSLIPSAYEVGTLAAPLADKILKGTPAGTIPVATPGSVFEVNYKAIQKLGLTISEGLLSTASKVVH